MKDWVNRLEKCGIPRKTAQTIVDHFCKARQYIELIAYIRMTEDATKR